ncbi:cache domain-containing sensor histidine kinase [Cohnella thailandensis]|uniref:histidine kinase n=1 Tax=Cohnella thailandensis TaxID=557557 RepID=A0A841SWY0_9BACL|nr:sensor histidine kinase [Cohnella thailandensis]MBB6634645.1 histidine kinase [Cohnella thailandensis]MBP1972799.1 two-component system sensor histidine kinase YesM [Cohnella thailandensis]
MRWERWLNRYSIKFKLILILLAATLSSIGLTGAFSQYFYMQAAKKDFFQFADDASYRLNRQIELYFQQMKISVSSLLAGPLPNRSDLTRAAEDVGIIQNWLASEGPTSSSLLADLQDVLNNYVALNYSEVDSTFLVAVDGRTVSNLQGIDESIEEYRSEPWFGAEMNESLKVMPTHLSEQTGNQVISLIVPVFSTDTMQLAGRLIINLRVRELEKTIVSATLAKKGYFFIVSDDGTVVYHPDSSLLGLPIQDTELADLRLNRSSSVQTIQGTEMLVSSSESELASWKLVAMVPFAEMASGVKVARDAALAAILILVAIVLIVVPIAAQRFTRPLRELKRLMEQAEKGELDVRAEVVPGKDEIQLLRHGYNRMTSRLSQLIDTVGRMKVNEMNILLGQKEAMIRALQNQINPHLLYNTLEIINSLAYVERNERIQVIAKNLGDYYRYTASIQEPFVSLREEIEHAKKYLEIVKIRFPRHFQSRFYVNEKYLDARIVKCSLQPLVENAVKYAVEPNSGSGTVIVSAYHEERDLVIEVADNGGGIPADKLEQLMLRLDGIAARTEDQLSGSPSLGIANVHARLVLHHGPRYGLSIASFEGRGTVVSIRVPLEDQSGEFRPVELEE